MKTTIDVNGKPVEIELTQEQVEAIKKASQKITDRVKSYEEACNELGQSPLTTLEFRHLPDAKGLFALHKLTTIAKALNEGWTPDWNNYSQYKYYPWFKSVSSGSAFAFDGYDYAYSNTTVGSRLVFKSRELAEYAGNQFNDIYNDFLTL